MNERREKIVPIYIEDEMRNSYIDYSMSVIIGRALPDVRDGLKPVHRRILYSMNELGFTFGKPYKKSARVVGEVLGKYHPHGDAAVYDTLVRMVQDFSLRYPLIDGQGNFGSVDGDSPAAMRYTEVRMAKLADELLRDIDKETVDFVPNFDESLTEPVLLPTSFPNLLVNGSSGIAVGMATNIPPHNLGEVIDGLIAVIDKPDTEEKELLKFIKGPDFPTAGIIYGRQGIRDAYLTGKGKIIIRAKANIELTKKNERIIISEIPFQVNKASLIEKIAELVKEKKIDGISDLRDETDRDGIRVVIELKKEAQPKIVLNQLYKHTQMQVTFGAIMLVLVNNVPRILKLREILDLFIEHRKEIITKRTRFDLAKAEKHAHILEGLLKALKNIDAIIDLIKRSKSVQEAKEALIGRFDLTEIQAQAILEMRLQRLTGLERKKLQDEYRDILMESENLKGILESEQRLMLIVKQELGELKGKYGDERRTEIIDSIMDFQIEDLIAEEEMVITISHENYIKRLPISTYRMQRRGGKGLKGMSTKEEDFVEHIFIASTHTYILFFTNKGKCFWLKVHEIPQGGRMSKGKAIVNLLNLENDEKIRAFLPVKEFNDTNFVVMATKRGKVKKTDLSAFSNPRSIGIKAIIINPGDELLEAKLTTGDYHLVLATRLGLAAEFHENEIRPQGRASQGVKGITLRQNDELMSMVVIKKRTSILTVTEKGYGKKTPVEDYRISRRGAKGVINLKITEKNGPVVSVIEVLEDDEVILISQKGIIIRLPIASVRSTGRSSQGVKLINLSEDDRVMDVAIVLSEEKEKIDKKESIGGQLSLLDLEEEDDENEIEEEAIEVEEENGIDNGEEDDK